MASISLICVHLTILVDDLLQYDYLVQKTVDSSTFDTARPGLCAYSQERRLEKRKGCFTFYSESKDSRMFQVFRVELLLSFTRLTVTFDYLPQNSEFSTSGVESSQNCRQPPCLLPRLLGSR